jgi:hypothetical protein
MARNKQRGVGREEKGAGALPSSPGMSSRKRGDGSRGRAFYLLPSSLYSLP